MQSQFWPGFRQQCPAVWPVWARRWAGSSGSLTARLTALGHGFEVCLLNQGLELLPQAQQHWLGGTGVARCRSRSVLLLVGGQAMVAARTWMTLSGPRCDWPFWGKLGRRSLGSRLFSDPRVKRGPVHYRKLPRRSAWVKQLLGADFYQTLNQAHAVSGWYVRGARFSRPPGNTPLWVFEVFLPTLQNPGAGLSKAQSTQDRVQ